VDTLWSIRIAIENPPFVDDLPIQNPEFPYCSHVRLPVDSFLQVKESMSAAGAAYADAEASWRLPRFLFSIVGRAVMAVARKPKSKPLRRRRMSLPPRRKLLKRHRLELQGS